MLNTYHYVERLQCEAKFLPTRLLIMLDLATHGLSDCKYAMYLIESTFT